MTKLSSKPQRGRRLSPHEARRESWYRGLLDWKLRPAQQRIEDKYQEVKKRGGRFLFVNCSRRIGKTVWAAKKAIETGFACKNKNPRIKIGSAYYEDLVEFLIPSHELVLQGCPKAIEPKYAKAAKKYVFPSTKGQIKLVGLDLKPNGLRGNYADLVILEECGFMRRLGYLHSSVITPMFMYREGAMEVMIGTPPETPDHEFVTFMEKAKLDDAYVELTIDDNTELTQAEKEMYLAECLTDTDRLREYYCKVVVDASRAIVPEFTDDFVEEVPKDNFFQYYHLYDSMDLGVVDQTVCLFGYYDFRRSMAVVEDELAMSGPQMTTDALAESIKGREAVLWPGRSLYRRVADNDNPLLLQDMTSKHSLGFMPTRKDSIHAMVNEVRVWMKSGRIRVHPRCKQLIGCLKTGIWDERRREFMRSAVYGHYDALAALVYFIRNINVHTNPIPPTHAMDRSTHFIHKDYEKRAEVRALRKGLLGANK